MFHQLKIQKLEGGAFVREVHLFGTIWYVLNLVEGMRASVVINSAALDLSLCGLVRFACSVCEFAKTLMEMDNVRKVMIIHDIDWNEDLTE